MNNQQNKGNLVPLQGLKVLLFFLLIISYLSAEIKPRKVESIPFEVVGSYIVITTKINDSSPLKLILDTGIRNTMITELQPDDHISLNYSDVKDLMGLGAGKDLEAFSSNYNTLKIGKIKLPNKTVYVLQNNIFNLSKHSGSKINGLIGVDFFLDHTIEINYSTKRINFYEQTPFDPKGYSFLPITIEGQKLFVDLSVLEADSTRKNVKMLIDTGAELNAWFQTITNNSVKLPSKWVQGTIGEGLNGIITGKFAHIPEISFGDYKLKTPIVSFPDSSTIKGIITDVKRDGTIGSQLLNRFNIFIDFTQKKFYFKPNENFKRRFTYNIAGIEIIQITPSFPIIEVMAVWENSPAEKAGVLPGDGISEINGNSVFSMSLGEVRKVFETPSNMPLKISLKRNEKDIYVSIDMKEKI